jgi:TolB protein
VKVLKYIFCIVLSILMVSCEKEDLTFSQTGCGILFLSRRIENSGLWNLMVMNNDGSGQSIITDLPVSCNKPVVSHSGEMVVFGHVSVVDENYYPELYVIDTDGTNLTLIDRADRYCGSADWSKDDTKIIYSRNRNDSTNDNDLILYDVVTTNKDFLASSMNNISAKFSGDDRIVYCQTNGNSSNLYVMNMDGSNNQIIIANACCPVWSPDGKSIAYISSDEDHSPQIFVASSDGSESRQLTNASLPSWDSGFPPFGNYDPQWLPDGNKIVFVSEIHDGLPEIYIMNNDGSHQIRLTNTDRRNEHPEISKDGNFIVFSSNRDLNYNVDIFVMDADGNNQYALSKYSGDDSFPVLMNK